MFWMEKLRTLLHAIRDIGFALNPVSGKPDEATAYSHIPAVIEALYDAHVIYSDYNDSKPFPEHYSSKTGARLLKLGKEPPEWLVTLCCNGG